MKLWQKILAGLILAQTASADADDNGQFELSCITVGRSTLRICHSPNTELEDDFSNAFFILGNELVLPTGERFHIPDDAIAIIDTYLSDHDTEKQDLLILAGSENEGGTGNSNML